LVECGKRSMPPRRSVTHWPTLITPCTTRNCRCSPTHAHCEPDKVHSGPAGHSRLQTTLASVDCRRGRQAAEPGARMPGGRRWHARHACNGPVPHAATPGNPRLSNSVSSRSVFARRCSRETATLEGWITCAYTPRASSQRASQKPSRPASKASVIRVIVRPALTASSRQRCSTASNLLRGRQCAPGLGKRAGSCTYGALGLMSKPVGDSARSSRNFRLTVGHMETSEQRTAGYIYDDTSLGGTTCRPTTPVAPRTATRIIPHQERQDV
jgi:hypothetical protein